VSNNFRLAEIPALLGTVQQRRLPELVGHRRKVAKIYREILSESAEITPIDPAPHDSHAYWRYPALLNNGLNRGLVQREMANKYGTRVTWLYEPLCHQQPVFAGRYPDKDFPTAIETLSRMVLLPTHMGVDVEAAQAIAEGLQQVVQVKVRL